MSKQFYFENRKKVLFFFIITVVLISLLYSVKIYLTFSISSVELRSKVNLFFKENIGRAVKYEEIYFDIFGNIVITNLNISVSNDFNDNLSLIKSRETICRLNIVKIFKKQFDIKGVDFYDSGVFINKKWDDEYFKSVKELFQFKKGISEIKGVKKDSFYLSFNDTTITSVEPYEKGKFLLSFSNINSTFLFNKKGVVYSISGTVDSLINRDRNGTAVIKGRYNYAGKKHLTTVNINSLDAGNFKDILKHNGFQILPSGKINIKSKIEIDDKGIGLEGIIKFKELDLVSESEGYNITSKMDFKTEYKILFHDDEKYINVEKLILNNDDFNLSLSLFQDKLKKKDLFKVDVVSSDINLSKLSVYFTPYKDVYYRGKLKFSGVIDCDFKKEKVHKIKGDIFIGNFFAEKRSGENKKIIISSLNSKISISKEKFDAKFKLSSPSTFIKYNSTSLIEKWFPIESDSNIVISSRKIDYSIFNTLLKQGIETLYSSAYEDKKYHKKSRHFKKTFTGKFLNNNNINLKMDVKKILLNGRAQVNDLLFNINLKKGYLELDEFNLSGYNASYSLNIKGNFKSDYPYVDIFGKIKDFDIAALSKDGGSEYFKGGTGFFEIDYSLAGKRLSHLFNNSKGYIEGKIESGRYVNKKFFKRINNFVLSKNYSIKEISEINFSKFYIMFHQAGNNFYFKDFVMKGDSVKFDSHGDYSYTKGIDLPVKTSLYKSDEKIVKIPFKIQGPFKSPDLQIKKKKSEEKFIIWNYK